MNNVRRIVKNSGASFLARVSTPASSFLLVFFIARFLGVAGLGTYASALSMLYMFQAFTSLGFQQLITREIAQDKSKTGKIIFNASLIGFIFSILMTGVMCLTVNIITDNSILIHAVYILSISLSAYILALVYQSISRGFEKLEHITIAIVIGNAFKLIIGVFVLFKGYGLLMLMIVVLGSQFITLFISFYFAVKFISKPLPEILKIDFTFCKWLIKATPIFAFIFIFSAIRNNVNVIILTSMMGPVEVGLYSAASKLMNIFMIGTSSYIIALQPVIFRFFSSSIEKFKLACVDSIRYLFIIVIPIVVVTTLLGDKFILLIFKKEFIHSADVLSIIIWIIIVGSVNQIFANALIASNDQKINLQANLIGMFAVILLNLLLIPKIGFVGAGIAYIVSAFVTLIYQYHFVSRHLFKVRFIKLAIKPFASAAIMGMVILFSRDTNLFFLLLVSTSVYIISLLVLKTFLARDIDLLRKILKGNRDLSISKSSI